MLKGNVIPKAIGKYRPGSAFGAANFIAAGTAIYDALAANTANTKRFPTLCKQTTYCCNNTAIYKRNDDSKNGCKPSIFFKCRKSFSC